MKYFGSESQSEGQRHPLRGHRSNIKSSVASKLFCVLGGKKEFIFIDAGFALLNWNYF